MANATTPLPADKEVICVVYGVEAFVGTPGRGKVVTAPALITRRVAAPPKRQLSAMYTVPSVSEATMLGAVKPAVARGPSIQQDEVKIC